MEIKLFGLDISIYTNNDWKQLRALWDKDIKYNWYSFSIVRLSWSFNFIKSTDDLLKNIGDHIKIYNAPQIAIGIIICLLGFHIVITAFKDRRDIN